METNSVKSTYTLLKLITIFFSRTDGRDKLAKFLQNFCRYKKYYSREKKTKLHWKNVQASLSEFRSILKFGKPFKNIVEVNETMSSTTLDFIGYLKIFSLFSDIGYKLGDNIEYLAHYQFLSYNEKKCEIWSKTFQWYAYFCDVITGLFDIMRLKREDFKTQKQYAMKRWRMMIYWTGDLSDFFRVTPSFLKMYGLMAKHDGFSGIMGVWVGLTGCYKVWNNITQ